MKTMSKILATILLVVLCVSLFTVQAFAKEGEEITEVHDAVEATCEHPAYGAYVVCKSGRKYNVSDASAYAEGMIVDMDDADLNPNAPEVTAGKKDHEANDAGDQEPTCTQPGYFICKY